MNCHSFYILSKRFVLKREELSDPRVASTTNKEYDFEAYFLKFSFVWNFHNKTVHRSLSNIFGTAKYNLSKVNKRNV